LKGTVLDGGTGIIAAPLKSTFKKGKVIAEVLDVDLAGAVDAARKVPLDRHKNLSYVTQTTDEGKWKGCPVLACFPTRSLLDKLDDPDARISEVCVIPWSRNEVLYWAQTWNPKIISIEGEEGIFEKMLQEGKRPSLNSVVRAALLSLTTSVNMSTGLSHPSDRSAAVWTFRILRRGGYSFDPDELRAFALREGWITNGADDLMRIADHIMKGRSPPAGRRPFVPNILDIWNERANEQR
jgi:hypothetical protein